MDTGATMTDNSVEGVISMGNQATKPDQLDAWVQLMTPNGDPVPGQGIWRRIIHTGKGRWEFFASRKLTFPVCNAPVEVNLVRISASGLMPLTIKTDEFLSADVGQRITVTFNLANGLCLLPDRVA